MHRRPLNLILKSANHIPTPTKNQRIPDSSISNLHIDPTASAPSVQTKREPYLVLCSPHRSNSASGLLSGPRKDQHPCFHSRPSKWSPYHIIPCNSCTAAPISMRKQQCEVDQMSIATGTPSIRAEIQSWMHPHDSVER